MTTPPLMLGATFLFWGFAANQIIIAALCAVAAESHWLIPTRWDLQDTHFSRAGDLCTVAVMAAVVYRLLTGWMSYESWVLLKWAPPLLLPLILAQFFSTGGKVNLWALLIIGRKKNRAGGGPELYVDLSYPYAVICLLAAGAANTRTPLFYTGLLVPAVWALARIRPPRYPAGVWCAAWLAAAAVGFGLQLGLSHLQQKIEAAGYRFYANYYSGTRNPFRNRTQMGDIGRLKPSNRIIMRVKADKGGPLLLREAVYDILLPHLPVWASSTREFKPLQLSTDGRIPGTAATTTGVGNRISVSFSLQRGQGLLKLPAGMTSFRNLPTGGLNVNAMGTVKIEGRGLATYDLAYSGREHLMAPPGKADLYVKPKERATIERLVENISLQGREPPWILSTLRTYFDNQFTYTLDLKQSPGKGTPLENFLLSTRAGHCEYFATATVLLLRGSGIPARYATGFGLNPQKGSDRWQAVRERQAHAWALAYVGGSWVNFDTTPADWEQREGATISLWDRINDAASWAMFRFVRWRWQDDGDALKKYAPWILALLTAFLIVRILVTAQKPVQTLLKSNRRRATGKSKSAAEPFQRVELRLNRLGYYRQPWQPAASWITRLAAEPGLSPTYRLLRQITDLHYRRCFGPAPLPPKEHQRLMTLTDRFLSKTKRPNSDRAL